MYGVKCFSLYSEEMIDVIIFEEVKQLSLFLTENPQI